MKRFVYILWCLVFFECGFSQNQYALLIGINDYAGPQAYTPVNNTGRIKLHNLDGCRNDVAALYSIIVSRYHFLPKNVDTLLDQAATRDAILDAFNALLHKCKAGDIAFIYYAGHGSQVKNSYSVTKLDQLDETIVPADSWKEGVKDIRDKELARRFNEFIDKNIKLTIIFDCCHSGTISRGPHLKPGKLRYVPAENSDAMDSSHIPIPEYRDGDNFLIMTATQADDFAAEIEQSYDDGQTITHGAFTFALTEALRQVSDQASVSEIFTRTRAILKNFGRSQEPWMAAQTARESETLFGMGKGNIFDYTAVPVSKIDHGKIILAGGFALGIYRGNELAMINEKDNNDTLFKIQVEQVNGVSESIARIVAGDIAQIKTGNLFRVTNWASPDVPLLNVCIPKSSYSEEDIARITHVAQMVKQSHKTRWLDNLKHASPFVTIFFDNNKCYVKIDRHDAEELKNVNAQAILDLCKDSSLYFEIPVSKDSSEAIEKKISLNHNIHIVRDAAKANYCLFGILGLHDLPAYGFRKIEMSASDSLESMPLATDCFEIRKNKGISIGDSLAMSVKKLSKLRGWLDVIEPPQTNEKRFPFHIEAIDISNNTSLRGGYRIGDRIQYILVPDSDYHRYESSIKVQYIYIFGMDQRGGMYLYLPAKNAPFAGNKYPQYANEKLVDTVAVTGEYKVHAPTGTDNIFLLATENAIPNPEYIFNQDPVATGVTSRKMHPKEEEGNLFYQLLQVGDVDDGGGKHFRGEKSETGKPPKSLPSTWSLLKFSFKCTY